MSINTMGTFESEDLKRQVEQLTQQLEALQLENSSLKSQSEASADSNNSPEVRSTPAESGVEVANIQEGDITLRRLVQRIAMILQAEKIVIMFYETESSELVAIPPAYGVDDEKLAHFRVRATQGITGEVFREAVRENAASVIVAHNHPSGDPTPSPEDISITRKLMEVGDLLDVRVLDHVIIGHKGNVSLMREGQI